MKRWHRGLAGALCGVLLLCGCVQTDYSPESDGDSVQSTLCFFMEEIPQSLDPLLADTQEEIVLTERLCEGLLEYQADTQTPSPCLARNWDTADDGLSVTFYLEETAMFADGTPLNADAVLKNLSRWQQGSEALRAQLSAITSAQAVDEYRVVFSLSRPDAGLFSVLCAPQTALVSPAAIEADTVSSDPQGTGAYTPTRGEDEILLVEKENYWRGETSISSISCRKASAEQKEEIFSGEQASVVVGSLADSLTPANGFERFSATGMNGYGFYLNLTRLSGADLCETLCGAVKESVVSPAGTTAMSGLLPDTVCGGVSSSFAYENDVSLSVCAGNSYTLLLSAQDETSQILARQIVRLFEKQDITVTLSATEPEQMNAAIEAGDYDFCLLKIETYGDCTDALARFSSTASDPTHCGDETLYEAVNTILAEAYSEVRQNDLELCLSLIDDRAAAVGLSQEQFTVISSVSLTLSPWGGIAKWGE